MPAFRSSPLLLLVLYIDLDVFIFLNIFWLLYMDSGLTCYVFIFSWTSLVTIYELVICRLQPEAKSQAKLSQNKPGQAGPKLWPEF